MISRAHSRCVMAVGWLALMASAAAQISVEWTGLGANTQWSTPANWQGNTAPANDGTASILFGNAPRTVVLLDTAQSVDGLTFDFSPATVASYYLSASPGAALTLGSGGITLLSRTGGVTFAPSLGLVLGSAQTWTTSANSPLHVTGTISGAGTLTVTGDGYIGLSGNNTHSGGTIVENASLGLESDTALGTGPLTATGHAALFSNASRTFANALNLNSSLLDLLFYGGDATFTGPVTLGANTTLNNYGQSVSFNGAIGESGGARSLTISGYSPVILSGANTYTGGTAVYGTLFFRNANSVPATGALSNSAQGYIGIGFNTGVQSGFIAKFAPASTFGTIGFDTEPGADSAAVFAEPINLSAFNAFARLGSATRATLSSTALITPATGAGFRFGGGGGTLKVDSRLTGANSLTADSSRGTELTVQITSLLNTYTGQTSATHSALVFSAGALSIGSANGSFTLGAGGYIGTLDLTLLPSLWISKFSPATQTGVIGFDSPDINAPRTIGSILIPIDLTQFAGSGTTIALGTSSAAILAGTINLPAGQTNYHFTGYKGGWLTVDSTLSGARGVRIGDASGNYPEFDRNNPTRMSTVFLTANNTYSGGTSLFSGRLVLGHANALGGGALTVNGRLAHLTPRLETSLTSNPTFANGLIVEDSFVIGGANAFTWSGTIANGVNTGTIQKLGASNLTLSGNNNAFSGGFNLAEGTITFASNTAAGTGPLQLGNAGLASFTSAAPTLNGLESASPAARVNLASGTTLTLNQPTNSTYSGQLQGAGGIAKTGPGTLRLESASNYTGGTTITTGTLDIAHTGALGDGTVTLNGTSALLQLGSGVSLANIIAFGGSGGTLAGYGTFASSVTLGANAGLSPGASIGTLTFTNGLTLNPGGFYDFEIQDATGGAGLGWDNVQVSGALTFNATLDAPFTLNLLSLNSSGTNGDPLNFSANNAYTWSILSATSLVGFDPAAVALNTSGFTAALNGGSFNLSTSGNSILLNFTPVPEPSTWVLLVTGLGALAFTRFRRRR